jgi:hypothetical protein
LLDIFHERLVPIVDLATNGLANHRNVTKSPFGSLSLGRRGLPDPQPVAIGIIESNSLSP